MATQAIPTESARRRWRDAAKGDDGDPAIPPALAFLMACAASVAAWAGVLTAAYLVLGRLG